MSSSPLPPTRFHVHKLPWLWLPLVMLPLVWSYLPLLERLVGRGTAPPLVLAVAGPQSGPDQAKGEAMVHGARLLVDQVNSRGGIQGVPVQLAIYDDLNQPDQACSVAEEIAGNPQVLAVLGHRTSRTSLAAGPVYGHCL